MSIGKSVLREPWVREAACFVAAHYVRLVRASGRWTEEGTDIRDRMIASGRPFIVCFWHGQLLLMTPFWPRRMRIKMLISRHRDGQLIARTAARFGIGTIEGSSSKGGGARALRMMTRALQAGECVGVTPDGPRGPRMRANAGVIHAARLAGVPIVPAAGVAARRRVLGSWDRFVVPLPFAGGVVRWGEPIAIDGSADPEAARRRVEDTLNAMTRELEMRYGHVPIDPAPEPAIAGATHALAG